MKRVVVVGGGIAGVAAAAHLAPRTQVTLLEMESTLAYHTTGRSAATFLINYGGKGARPLAAASQSFYENPPPASTDSPLLSPRGALWIATQKQISHLESLAAAGRASGAGSVMVDAQEVRRIVPALDPAYIAGGLWETSARDIDVAGLHQAFVRIARRHEAEIRTGSPVVGIATQGTGWSVRTHDAEIDCDVIINAAGAWGDRIATLAGVDPIGLVPMRRTAFMVPGDEAYSDWPLVVDVDEGFYFRPDGTQLLCSLAEEIPADPGDPRPNMEDVALAIDRINTATTLGIRTVNSQWTGLRTFVPDRDLVIGEDPTAPGFFWLVGQGGIGIMTSPGYGELIASQVLEDETPANLLEAGVDPGRTLPDRFRT